jgi:hypothetical protein
MLEALRIEADGVRGGAVPGRVAVPVVGRCLATAGACVTVIER